MSGRRFGKAVQDLSYLYLTSSVLPPKRLKSLKKKQAKDRKKAAEIIELWKRTYCVPDHINGGWKCLDHMIIVDENGKVDGLTVADMARMLKKGVRL